ncbi:MAG: hypothetical protein OXL96_05595 [Candidatus Poribacteria bacterium]|nr:hypothetical protein [Candidatus Poribacteria bacterium]
MLVKFLIIVTALFLFTGPVFAGTFLETFNGKDLEGWQEIWADKGPTVTGDSVPNSGDFAVTPEEKLATTWAQLKKF